VYNVTKMITSV